MCARSKTLDDWIRKSVKEAYVIRIVWIVLVQVVASSLRGWRKAASRVEMDQRAPAAAEIERAVTRSKLLGGAPTQNALSDARVR